MSYNKFSKFSVLLLSAATLGLGACAVNHPNAMPSGYTYHHESYKSPTPPASSKITQKQRVYMDAAQAEQFRDAVYDVLARLTQRAGMPPKPVYILQPDPMTAFYANIDNDLRESMRHIGYALSDMPLGAYIFAYDAMVLPTARGVEPSTGHANIELVLKVFDKIGEDARMLSEESGRYFIQGAEFLKIQPSNYSLLPNRDKIRQQAAGAYNTGVGEIEEPRTATEGQYYSYTPSSVSAPLMPATPSINTQGDIMPDAPRRAVSIEMDY